MPRAPRLQIEDGIYHVTSRGVERRAVYMDRLDRFAFLDRLADVVVRFEWTCFAYCLMTNHFHLLVQTPKPNIAAGMHRLNGLFAQRFNRRYARSGHLFESRYGDRLIEGEGHLLEACRYVVLNPVRAGICALPEEWEWSSYRATAELDPPPAFVAVDWLLDQFEGGSAQYRAFVADGIGRDMSAARPRPGGPRPGARPRDTARPVMSR